MLNVHTCMYRYIHITYIHTYIIHTYIHQWLTLGNSIFARFEKYEKSRKNKLKAALNPTHPVTVTLVKIDLFECCIRMLKWLQLRALTLPCIVRKMGTWDEELTKQQHFVFQGGTVAFAPPSLQLHREDFSRLLMAVRPVLPLTTPHTSIALGAGTANQCSLSGCWAKTTAMGMCLRTRCAAAV